MTPIGPYLSPWADRACFLIRTGSGFGIVVNGNQPHEATPVATLREGRDWLRDNGYTLKTGA